MAQVQIKLTSDDAFGSFYFTKDPVGRARELLVQNEYITRGEFETLFEGAAAAEEAFDLTNNPSREAERALRYGQWRSVSVGDIAVVDGVNYLCCSLGWKVVDTPTV